MPVPDELDIPPADNKIPPPELPTPTSWMVATWELISHLRRFRLRLRVFNSWEAIQRDLWLSLFLSIGIQLLGRLFPLERLLFWTAVIPSAWILLILMHNFLRPYSFRKTALRVDVDLHLKERLSTCLALQEMNTTFPQTLISFQQQDCLRAARRVDIKTAYPLNLNQRMLAKTAVSAIILAVLFSISNPMDEILARRQALKQEAAEQAKLVEELRREIGNVSDLDPELRREIENQLSELAEKLNSNSGNLDQALADIHLSQTVIESYLNPDTPIQAANLNSLVKQLASLSGNQPNPLNDLAAQAQSALAQLMDYPTQLSEEQRQARSASLAQMAAQASQSGNSQLSESLFQLSKSLGTGDQEGLRRSAQQTSQAVNQALGQIQVQSRLDDILASLVLSQQALAHIGQSTAQGLPSPSNQSQTSGGGGTKASVLPPGTSQGLANPPQGNQPYAAEDDLIGLSNVMQKGGSSVGDELYIPGINTGLGTTYVKPGDSLLPGATNPSLVPYQQAYFSYLNTAMQSLSQDYIPVNLVNYVRQYFLQLEPQ